MARSKARSSSGGLSPLLIRNRAIDRLNRLLNFEKGVDQLIGPRAGIPEHYGLAAALIYQRCTGVQQVLDGIGQRRLRLWPPHSARYDNIAPAGRATRLCPDSCGVIMTDPTDSYLTQHRLDARRVI